MNALNYKQRVAKGAALLDECRPGWEKEVDTSILDLSSGYLCILGQVYGAWDVGIGDLEARGVERVWDTQALYGFNHGATYEGAQDYARAVDKEYYWLKRRWTELIESRTNG